MPDERIHEASSDGDAGDEESTAMFDVRMIKGYLHGELTPDERSAVEERLVVDADFRELQESLKGDAAKRTPEERAAEWESLMALGESLRMQRGRATAGASPAPPTAGPDPRMPTASPRRRLLVIAGAVTVVVLGSGWVVLQGASRIPGATPLDNSEATALRKLYPELGSRPHQAQTDSGESRLSSSPTMPPPCCARTASSPSPATRA